MERKFIFNKKLKSRIKDKITLVTYNILAPITVPPGSRHEMSCDTNCLKWDYRFPLIKKEIVKLKPDIICLQEAQSNLVYKDIFPYFFQNNYYGYFTPQKNYIYDMKKNISVDPNDDQNTNFGNVILFKTNRFYSLEINTINYHQIVEKFLENSKLLKFKEKVKRKYCGLAITLKDSLTNKKLVVSTVHLEHNPKFDDIKSLQIYITLKSLFKITENNSIPLILCGDFNSTPKSHLYKSITKGITQKKYDESVLKPIIRTPDNYSYIKLISAYKKIVGSEPKYTNYTEKFKETLDYIFTNQKIKIISVLQEIDVNFLKKFISIPTKKIPSDHILQSVQFKLN